MPWDPADGDAVPLRARRRPPARRRARRRLGRSCSTPAATASGGLRGTLTLVVHVEAQDARRRTTAPRRTSRSPPAAELRRAALAFRGATLNRRTNERSRHAPGAVGRRDPQGRRQLPRLGGARAGRRRALARPHQGRRGARERRPRAARRRPRAADRRRRPTRSREGKHDAQFPIDVFQTGSGTSSNMNANEVIATLAGDGAHPNDHVNMGQSSNDVFPSAVHLAALDEATNTLLPALERLEKAFAAKAEEFKDIVKSGRTHLMDAVPVTLGQEFAGYAAQIRLGRARVADALPRVAQIPLGGTATGTGLNTHPRVRGEGARALCAPTTGLDDPRARGPVRGAGQPRRAGRAVRRAEGDRGLADQDRQRPRADGLRPARRHRRAVPARAAEGLLDHARQGQPGAARRSCSRSARR